MAAKMNADDLVFIEEEEDESFRFADAPAALPPWKVLIVDDDPQVHTVTRLSLRRFTFENRPIEILNALSAAAAGEILANTPDIAAAFLDVVMETDDAGLRLVRHIRQTLGNQTTRLILRTGQPGLAPEQRIVVDFDINDYWAKTELTHERLLLCTISALRSYRDIMTLKNNNAALRRVAESAVDMFRADALHPLLDTVLARLAAILGSTADAALFARQTDPQGGFRETMLVSGFGRFAGGTSRPPAESLSEAELAAVTDAIVNHHHIFASNRIVLALDVPDRWSGAILIPDAPAAGETQKRLVDIFITIVKAALDNLHLMDELRRSNRATVVALADLAENRDTDTGEHILRVARLTGEIGRELLRRGHPEVPDARYVEQTGLASMLHDLGKVGIPDEILRKRGKLTPEERTIMETHTTLGGTTLEKARHVVSGSRYLDLGWEIATGHHEAFDGTGYPRRLKGTEIPMSARIASVADVFDALTSARSYKPAWTIGDAIAFITENKGSKFDPAVVDAFMEVIVGRASTPRIVWTPEMSVGNRQIDADHQQLISLINQLSVAGAGNDRTSIEFVLDELVQYTLLHFAREEELMKQIGYPNLASHRAAHTALTNRVKTLRTLFFNGLSTRLDEDILSFLGTWLSTHILKEDLKYAPLLAAASSAQA